MIPDKIYLPVVEEEGKRLLSTIWWPEDNRPSNEKFVVDAIPYIHKDALLELIKDEAKFWDDGEMIFGQLLDKLNSM